MRGVRVRLPSRSSRVSSRRFAGVLGPASGIVSWSGAREIEAGGGPSGVASGERLTLRAGRPGRRNAGESPSGETA